MSPITGAQDRSFDLRPSELSRPYILGIDPGIKGAFCVYDAAAKEIIELHDMPVTSHKAAKGRSQVDGYLLSATLSPHAAKIRCAVIEKVSAMTYVDSSGQKRGQGAAASFAFGKSAGIAEGVVEALMIPIFFVEPSVWKSLMGLNQDKTKSRTVAAHRFPDHIDTFSRAKDDGRAEAALLALFGAQRFFR